VFVGGEKTTKRSEQSERVFGLMYVRVRVQT
jgi:hypothetical protein